jgi:hypothetical protein
MVDQNDYKAMLELAVAELSDLLTRRDALDTERERMDARIAELKQGIIALGPLAGVSPHNKYVDLFPEYDTFPNVGLKDAIIAVLDKVEGDAYLTPVSIRDRLPSSGYEIKSKNILPSIHTVLKRFEGRQVESDDVNGKTGYRLIKKDRPRRPGPFDRLKRNSLKSLEKGETSDAFLNAVIKAGKTARDE